MTPQYTRQFNRRNSTWKRNQNITKYSSNVKLGPVMHTILVALMITILGLIYLTQATQATSYDYRAQEIDNEIAELNNQKTDLEVESARLTALETVKNSAVASSMTKSKETRFVNE